MTPNPVTAHSEMSLDDAMAVFDRHSFRHLPVTHEGKLVGMLSDRDVRLATGWLTIEQRRQGKRSEVSPSFVGEVMRAPALSIMPETPAKEVVDRMLELKVGAFPVKECEEVVGVVTATNLIQAFCDLALNDKWEDLNPPIARYMSPQVITLSLDDYLDHAIAKCHDEQVRHLPVVESGEVIGIVSDRDIRLAMGQEIVSAHRSQDAGTMALHRTSVKKFMTPWVSAIDKKAPLSTAGEAMMVNRFSALPVSSARKLVGIITQSDILEHFARIHSYDEV